MACSNDVTSLMSSQVKNVFQTMGERGHKPKTLAGLEGSEASNRSERFSSCEIR